MGITEGDLKAFPPGEELIDTVKDAVGRGDKSRQRQAQETLAFLFDEPFKRLIRFRYEAYFDIGGLHEGKDDLQRLYLYIFFGHRETSKGELNSNEPPLLTWLKKVKDKDTAKDLKRYVITTANRYLKIDLSRNIRRGRGHETLVQWNEGEATDGDETAANDRMDRALQLDAVQKVCKEKIHRAETLELSRCVRESLDLMPCEDAALLLAKHCQIPDEGFTQVEYARKMGVSESTVSRRLTKAEETLASLLRSKCPDLLERLGWSKQA
jgi:DNA-directed RNA polymerase specialized sigma24 family protein